MKYRGALYLRGSSPWNVHQMGDVAGDRLGCAPGLGSSVGFFSSSIRGVLHKTRIVEVPGVCLSDNLFSLFGKVKIPREFDEFI